jgi:hypothetical protein
MVGQRMPQENENFPTQVQQDKSLQKKDSLHITYHNPNTLEETAKYLARIIVQSLVEQATTRK